MFQRPMKLHLNFEQKIHTEKVRIGSEPFIMDEELIVEPKQTICFITETRSLWNPGKVSYQRILDGN